jgi:hypothetical protein
VTGPPCDPPEPTAQIVDMIASEYGWDAQTTMDMPIDQVQQLAHAIMHRRGLPTIRRRIKFDTPDVPLAERLKSIFGEIDNDP